MTNHRYRIRHWRDYNSAFVRRGSLTLWADTMRKMITTLTSEIPAEYKPKRADTLRSILSLGGVLVLADLSLQLNGFGQAIDYFLSPALKELREGFTEEVQCELVKVNKVIPEVMETYVPKVMNVLVQEAPAGLRQ